MWGKLDGERQTKLVQARDALRKSLSLVKPNQRFGLASYGHRRAGECSDVAIITQPENATPEHIADHLMTPLEKLNPKGKGPLTIAMKEAAKVLAKSTGPRSLILIHDDLDNCQQDACAALSEIQTITPSLMIHVIGLGLREGDATKYQCLTKPTGGRHINAQNAEQISTGIDDVIRASMLEPVRAAIRPAGAEILPKAPPPKPVDLAIDGPPALRLKAYLAPGVPMPSKRQIYWTLQSESKPNAATVHLVGAELLSPQDAGTYRIVVEDGVLRNETTITVKAKGHTAVDAVFNAGLLRLRPPLAAYEIATVFHDDQPTQTPAKITPQSAPTVPPRVIGIFRNASAGTGTGTGTGVETSAPEITVPEGQLLIRRTLNRRVSHRKIAIKAGTVSELDFGPALGVIQAQIAAPIANDGKDPRGTAPTIIALEEDDPDQSRGRRQIAQSAATVAEFAVSPGTYTLVASKGTLEYRERIAVNAGEMIKRVLPLNGARISVSTRITSDVGASTAPKPTVWYHIERLDNATTEPLSSFDASPVIDVAPGRYRITAKVNGMSAQTSADVDIALGDQRALVLQLPLALARITPGPALKADGDLVWRIETPNQERLWSDGIGNGPVWLPAGTYTIKAEGKTTSAAVRVDLKPGESRTISVGN